MKVLSCLLVLLALAGCEPAPTNFEGGVAPVEKTPVEKTSQSMAGPGPSTTVRKLIRTGHLNISVVDVNDVKSQLAKICEETNAYVSSEHQNNYRGRIEFEQVIRIPSDAFDVFVQKVEGLAEEVESKHIQSEDVTEEFIDKEARIKTKKELENRYRDILKQAKQVSDILSIEAQMNQVRADIEAMEGRLNYLRNQVAFSTLTVTFYEPVGAVSDFGSRTIAAFGNGWDLLLTMVIGLLNLWPFLIIAGLVGAIVLKRRQKKGRAVS